METVVFDGLEVTLACMTLTGSERWQTLMPSGVWCGIVAEGTIATTRAGRDDTWRARTTINCLLDDVQPVDHRSLAACQLSAVFIRVPFERLETLVGAAAGSLSPRGSAPIRSWHDHRAATAIAWQMLGCPLSGPARGLYISAKSLEILSLVTDRAIAEATTRPGGNSLPGNASEVERTHAARAILLSELADVPTVPELGRRVGLNARRLSELFKIHFGTTVYAYAKGARLDHAKLMLESGEITVAQAAYSSGYNPAHFSAEFRKRFGCSPSTCCVLRAQRADSAHKQLQ